MYGIIYFLTLIVFRDKMEFSYFDGFTTFVVGVLLPTIDIYLDVTCIELLLTIERNESDHVTADLNKGILKEFGMMMILPLILNTLLTLPHWFVSEKTWPRRLITFILVILQLYPQYRSIRILWLSFCRKNLTQSKKEQTLVGTSISHVGKYTYSIVYVSYVILKEFVVFRAFHRKRDSSSLVVFHHWIANCS